MRRTDTGGMAPRKGRERTSLKRLLQCRSQISLRLQIHGRSLERGTREAGTMTIQTSRLPFVWRRFDLGKSSRFSNVSLNRHPCAGPRQRLPAGFRLCRTGACVAYRLSAFRAVSSSGSRHRRNISRSHPCGQRTTFRGR